MNGLFKQNLVTGKMSFDYTIDTITIPGVYEFARQFGKTTAGYLFDYLMNSYVEENLPADYPYERYYYHYDQKRDYLYPIDSKDGFIELENK
jgi:hypothetical protein